MPFRLRLCAIAACTAIVAGSADAALAQTKEPIGRFVIDLRAASVGLPSEPGWIPQVPEGTEVPARKLGFEIGAHVYPVRWSRVALGVGGTYLAGRGTTTTESAGMGARPVVTEVTTQLRSLAPQLSINFGHSLGWSYVSAGLGRTRVESDAIVPPAGGPQPPARVTDWTKTLNYGAGARWFITERVGVGFDLRWHKVSLVEASATHPGAPRASLFTAAVGVVLK